MKATPSLYADLLLESARRIAGADGAALLVPSADAHYEKVAERGPSPFLLGPELVERLRGARGAVVLDDGAGIAVPIVEDGARVVAVVCVAAKTGEAFDEDALARLENALLGTRTVGPRDDELARAAGAVKALDTIADALMHEINNALSVIVGNAASVVERLEETLGAVLSAKAALYGIEDDESPSKHDVRAATELLEAVRASEIRVDLDGIAGDMKTASARIARTLDTYRDLGKPRLDHAAVSLADEARKVVKMYAQSVPEQECALVLKIDDGGAPRVASARDVVQHLLVELVGEAVRAARARGPQRPGRVVVRVGADGQDAMLSVLDDGRSDRAGDDEADAIAAPARIGPTEAVARAVVELGGRVEVDAVADVGTLVKVALPRDGAQRGRGCDAGLSR